MPAPDGRCTGYDREGLHFDVRDEGPPGGDPVVLLHGFPQDAGTWDRVVPRLHDAGLRTLAPDQRGYSPRARPRSRAAYRMSALADDVVELLDVNELEHAHVVGHDWGGAVGWDLAGRFPDRVRSLTVLSTPHPAAMVSSMASSSQALMSWYMGAFQLPLLPELALGGTVGALLRRSGLPPGDAERYRRRMSEPGALSAALGWYRAIPFSIGSSAPACRVPTTYVWGRHDVALGRRAAELTERHVDAPYRFVELDAGHWLPELAHREVASAVLDRVSPGPVARPC